MSSNYDLAHTVAMAKHKFHLQLVVDNAVSLALMCYDRGLDWTHPHFMVHIGKRK